MNPWAREKEIPSTAVWMVSGTSGAPLWHRSFEGSSGNCVATFTSCTDRNDDGIRDVALVLAQPKALEPTQGYWDVRFVLQFLDGASGKLIERIEPHAVARAATWSASIVEIGDVNEDSTPELAIGTATSRRGLLGVCGCVTIVSGVDGKGLLELDGGEGGFAVGWSLARLSFASDFGLAVGAPDCGLAPGYVARFRGREFQRLSSLRTTPRD